MQRTSWSVTRPRGCSTTMQETAPQSPPLLPLWRQCIPWQGCCCMLLNMCARSFRLVASCLSGPRRETMPSPMQRIPFGVTTSATEILSLGTNERVRDFPAGLRHQRQLLPLRKLYWWLFRTAASRTCLLSCWLVSFPIWLASLDTTFWVSLQSVLAIAAVESARRATMIRACTATTVSTAQ